MSDGSGVNVSVGSAGIGVVVTMMAVTLAKGVAVINVGVTSSVGGVSVLVGVPLGNGVNVG